MPEIDNSYQVAKPRYFIPHDTQWNTAQFYDSAILRHWDIVNSITPDATNIRPFMFITILPEVGATEATSGRNDVIEARYQEIDRDLEAIRRGELTDDTVEIGAVETAKALVSQIRNKQIAPPELNWMGTEAIIMLWVVGQKKLALTITDGEFGYTLRDSGKTIQRRSNIDPSSFNLQRLR